LAMHEVFEVMDHSDWVGACQPANPG
jgi:hypothetical protein